MSLTRRAFLASAGSALAIASEPAAAATPDFLEGHAFGTTWRIAAAGSLDKRGVRAAFAHILNAIDACMSPFRPDSELSRFNSSTSTDWQTLSSDMCLVLAESLRMAEMTGGAFNPTVGPIVGRYGFGPIVAGLAGRPEDIVLRGNEGRKLRPDLSLDLCGIAKGFALDRLSACCGGLGITDYVIELGGEVVSMGQHPSGRRWHVGVENPADAGFRHAIAPEGQALATSGSRINGYAWQGRGYSHIIDPSTGLPASGRLASVTVAAPTAMEADALATALFALGETRGPACARRSETEALFILADGIELTTSGFESRFVEES